MAFGLRRANVLGYLSVQLVSKISNVCDPALIHQRYRQTDRQTTCDLNTALCTKVHRAVKMVMSVEQDMHPLHLGLLIS